MKILRLNYFIVTFLLISKNSLAHNCSSLGDCFSSMETATGVGIGIAILIIASILIDFTPIIGNIKGVLDGLLGRDIITGIPLGITDRVLGILPVAKLGNKIKNIAKYLNPAKRIRNRHRLKHAYDIARKAGGRHDGYFNKAKNYPDESIKKGINSHNTEIMSHQNKIKNPRSKYPEWDTKDYRQQNDSIYNKWPNDIQRHREQKEILEKILENRHKERITKAKLELEKEMLKKNIRK